MPITENEDTEKTMSSDAGIAVVRRNTEEVQSRGNFEVFEELFAADFVDHTPQPGGFTPDRDGARNLYRALRAAFPDFHAEIHWQISDGDRVTTYKTYHGTHEGTFWGLAPTGRKIHFETVDVMRVRNGKITDHWGVANLLSLLRSNLASRPPWMREGSDKENWGSPINGQFYRGRDEITWLVDYAKLDLAGCAINPWLRKRGRNQEGIRSEELCRRCVSCKSLVRMGLLKLLNVKSPNPVQVRCALKLKLAASAIAIP